MLGEITIAEGKVVESNFHDYRMIHLADAPLISVEFIRSDARSAASASPACRRSRRR